MFTWFVRKAIAHFEAKRRTAEQSLFIQVFEQGCLTCEGVDYYVEQDRSPVVMLSCCDCGARYLVNAEAETVLMHIPGKRYET